MAIVKMKKLEVIGMDSTRDCIISDLQDMGVVQIIERESEDLEENQEKFADLDPEIEAAIASIEAEINDAALALDVIKRHSTEKEPLFMTRRPVKEKDFDKKLKERYAIKKTVREILDLNIKLHKLKEERNRKVSDSKALAPWKKYDLPLDVTETEKTIIDIGIIPVMVDMDVLTERLEACSELISVHEINRDREFIYIFVISVKEKNEEIVTILRQYGYTPTMFRGFSGTPAENERAIEHALLDIDHDIEDTEEAIREYQRRRKDIECLYDALIIERDREKVKSTLFKTKRTFSLEGWIPVNCIDKATKLLEEDGCYFSFVEPDEDDDVPVLMQNSSFVYPFESVTEMYSLPAYTGVDPTKYFSIFYAMFFGLMLSDGGYGVVITLATFIVLKKFDLEGATYKMLKMFFYCGISTMVWGALFGGWFGDFISVAAKVMFNKDVTVPAIWFNPIEDPIKLLIFSLGIGIVHMFLGMGIKAAMLIKDGDWKSAVFDVFSWYMVIAGAVMWLGGSKISQGLPKIGMYLTLAGMLILLLTGGRNSKGFGKVLGGLKSIYDITGYASDILSYSRLLALGLATGVIAQVVNTMGSLAGGGIKGTIVLFVAFVLGHTFNLAINALGAFVHTSRLQYIEFFGKFYEEGGEAFEPFRRNTKYVRITNDTEE